MPDSRDIEWAQRISILELKCENLAKDTAEINTKLDELLLLRSKGMGAFWLASSLLGTGIIGVIFALVNYLRG